MAEAHERRIGAKAPRHPSGSEFLPSSFRVLQASGFHPSSHRMPRARSRDTRYSSTSSTPGGQRDGEQAARLPGSRTRKSSRSRAPRRRERRALEQAGGGDVRREAPDGLPARRTGSGRHARQAVGADRHPPQIVVGRGRSARPAARDTSPDGRGTRRACIPAPPSDRSTPPAARAARATRRCRRAGTGPRRPIRRGARSAVPRRPARRSPGTALATPRTGACGTIDGRSHSIGISSSSLAPARRPPGGAGPAR
jgi:hypothetical protein